MSAIWCLRHQLQSFLGGLNSFEPLDNLDKQRIFSILVMSFVNLASFLLASTLIEEFEYFLCQHNCVVVAVNEQHRDVRFKIFEVLHVVHGKYCLV